MTELSETFYMTVLTIGAGVLGLIIRALGRSKCDQIEVCCIKIHRDISAESKLDEIELAHPQSNTSL